MRVAGVRAVLFTTVVLALAPPNARGQLFVATGRDTLRGLPGVEVIVEPLQPELEQGGFTTALVAASVTQQLKAAGITIYASQRENPSKSQPYLYVHVNGVADEPGRGYAVAIQVHLRQTMASLTTESRVVNAMSWDAHSVAVVPVVLLKEDVSDEIDSLVARFIADWRAVH